MTRPNTSFTFQAPDIWLGEFRLDPRHPAWGRPNFIGDRAPLIAFPRTTVEIAQERRPRVVADPLRAVLYAAGQEYRRAVVSPEGDHCSFITFSHRLAAEAGSGLDPLADDPQTYRFPFVAASIDRTDYVLTQRVRRAVAEGGAEPEALLESLYWLLARVVASGYNARGSKIDARRRGTAEAHGEIADAVRKALGRDLCARPTLEELGSAVHLSPFHLSRVFREQTGRSIHAYRTEVRLRASLARIADGQPLADVAAAVGFASQAHLTDRFRRAYGVTPQAWRLSLRHGTFENRTNVESFQGDARIA